MVQAMVALFLLPVMPSRVWKRSPRRTPSLSRSTAWGWSPAGANSDTISRGGTPRSVPTASDSGSARIGAATARAAPASMCRRTDRARGTRPCLTRGLTPPAAAPSLAEREGRRSDGRDRLGQVHNLVHARRTQAVVVDADEITREVQRPGTEVFDRIVERFGPGVVQADGSLDRKELARLVFEDQQALRISPGSSTRRSVRRSQGVSVSIPTRMTSWCWTSRSWSSRADRHSRHDCRGSRGG